MSKKESEHKERAPSPDLGRREFVKKGAAALVLLPYVVPVIQSLTVTAAWADGNGPPSSNPGKGPPFFQSW